MALILVVELSSSKESTQNTIEIKIAKAAFFLYANIFIIETEQK